MLWEEDNLHGYKEKHPLNLLHVFCPVHIILCAHVYNRVRGNRDEGSVVRAQRMQCPYVVCFSLHQLKYHSRNTYTEASLSTT